MRVFFCFPYNISVGYALSWLGTRSSSSRTDIYNDSEHFFLKSRGIAYPCVHSCAHWPGHLAGQRSKCKCGYLEFIIKLIRTNKKTNAAYLLFFFAVKLDSFIQDRVGKQERERCSKIDHAQMTVKARDAFVMFIILFSLLHTCLRYSIINI